MALVKKAVKTFENPEDDATEVTESAAAETETKVSPEVSTTASRLADALAKRADEIEQAAALVDSPAQTKLVTKAANLPSVSIMAQNPFAQLENAFPVAFNTLKRVQADQGVFTDKDSEASLGPVIGIEVISTQNHWVLTPGDDDDEAAKFLKYSDDGVTTDDGLNLKEECRKLKEMGYPEARISERVYLVGCLFNAGTKPELNDTMVQIDLAPTSVAHFKRHQLSVAFNIGKGKATADGQHMLKLECVRKSKAKRAWTEVSFTQFK